MSEAILVNMPAHKHIPGVGDLYVQVPVDIVAYFKEKSAELDTLEARADGLLKKLDNKAFTTKAPPEIVAGVEESWLETTKHRTSVLLDMLDKIDALRALGMEVKL